MMAEQRADLSQQARLVHRYLFGIVRTESVTPGARLRVTPGAADTGLFPDGAARCASASASAAIGASMTAKLQFWRSRAHPSLAWAPGVTGQARKIRIFVIFPYIL